MNPIYTEEQFSNAKSRDLLPLQCEKCGNIFHGVKNEIQKHLSRKKRGVRSALSFKYCSKKCLRNGCEYNCKQCGTIVYRTPTNFKKCIKNVFCSSSCSATYNNTHKSTGYRRSKLEKWIEKKLNELYPTLTIDYNKTNAINAELDIYIPSLKLAFELNGIFHYEKIYKNFDRTKINDKRKFQACLENNIELCIIDTSKQVKFSERSSEQFLDIIKNIIDEKKSNGDMSVMV